ncbi:MAG: UV DNA damage repair endonuclease UvsE [Cellulosilyticum sp.]|nr:UV DNA damage repair endonuclease UvsE [Cellulosilyticum sp.]
MEKAEPNHNIKKRNYKLKEQNMEQVAVRAGYACLNLSLKESFRNYRLATVEKEDEEKITQVIWHNIRLLREIVEYNIKHNIYVYRVSSDLVPFCTHPYVKALYEEKVLNNEEMYHHFTTIRMLQEQYNLRMSIHPSQFNVLSSPKKEVVSRSVNEINAQTEWIKALKGENVVIHVGGSYGDKKSALQRFKENLRYVDQNLISIENDDKTYNVEEVVEICQNKHIKWVYDYHHDRCHPSIEKDVKALIKNYPPNKYHLSTGTPHSDSRPHADYISATDYANFTSFLTSCGIKQADVIFEAKKKNKAIFHILEPIGNGYWQLEGNN